MASSDESVPHAALARQVIPQRRYELDAELARGGMGAVWRARDRDIRREVAIKYLLDQSDRQSLLRFIEEAQITGQLEHPNIVPIHELGLDARQRAFFSMKLVKGRSLAQVLETVRNFPSSAEKEYTLTRLLGVFVSVCNALVYAHSHGVVHRDLKPANIMTGDFGEVYVMDWGLAKVLRSDANPAEPDQASLSSTGLSGAGTAERERPCDAQRGDTPAAGVKISTNREAELDLTQEGSVLGTPAYMSPEQASGQISAVNELSDIYALGAILYQILTLEPPVEKGGGFAAVLARVTEGKVLSPEKRSPQRAREGKIPAELSAIAMKALARSPQDRYPTAEALRRDVELFLEGRSVSAKEDTRRELLLKFIKRNKAFSAASGVALVVLGLVVGISLSINLQARREVEQAYKAYESEQKEKENRTRQAVPAIIKVARQEAIAGRTDDALRQIRLALEYDPESIDGQLLHAQLLIVKQDFTAAAEHLQVCVKGNPGNRLAADLLRLCTHANKDEPDKSKLVQIAQILTLQDCPTLAEDLLRQHGETGEAVRAELLLRLRERLALAWKGPGIDLKLTESGYHLQLKRDDIRDLAPLRDMPLRSIYLACPELDNLSGLEGMLLDRVVMHGAKVTHLNPLQGIALQSIQLYDCVQLADLSALQGMPLTSLVIEKGDAITDISPIKGMALTMLRLDGCPGLKNIEAVREMPLEQVEITRCPSLDQIGPLGGLPLTSLSLAGCSQIASLEPLRGMPIVKLDLSGCGKVSDLAPLQGMPLQHLFLSDCTLVDDIEPLKGMSLTQLRLTRCPVTDISALAGMNLNSLDLTGTDVKSLAPLSGMPITNLAVRECRKLMDLSGIKGMTLLQLDLQGCASLEDLSPLSRMSLRTLNLNGCVRVQTLQPLNGMPLNSLILDGCVKVTDLSPLKGAFLTQLSLKGCAGIRDLKGLEAVRFGDLALTGCSALENLRGLRGAWLKELYISEATSLRSLVGVEELRVQKITLTKCPLLEDISALKGSTVTQLHLEDCPRVSSLLGLGGSSLTVLQLKNCGNLKDLEALRGLKLTRLSIPGCKISHLSPLKDMPLKELNLAYCPVKDLSVVKGDQLTNLSLLGCTHLHDLTPLLKMPLQEITLPPDVAGALPILKKLTRLRRIDGLAADNFWKAHATKEKAR